MSALLKGETGDGRVALRIYINATIGFTQQATSGRSSCVGTSQISWSPILINASADRHFSRGMAW